jgi:TrkA-N domain
VLHFLNSAHSQLFLSVAASVLITLLLAYNYPRPFRTTIRELDRWSGLVILLLGLAVLFCGSIGFGETHQGTIDSIPVALYETIQLFALSPDPIDLNKSPWLKVAMVCATLLVVTVAAKGIGLLFHQSCVDIQLRLTSGHIVILGLGRIGRQLIEDLVKLGDKRTIVVVEPDEHNSNVPWVRDHGAIVLIGDATKWDSLQAAQVQKADEVFVVTGSDECNIESVIEIRDILKRNGRTDWIGRPRKVLRCHVHILDRDIAEIVRAKSNALEEPAKADEIAASNDAALIDVEVFNALERTTRRLLEEIATSTFGGQLMRPVADDEFAHFIVLGFGEFGQTLALKLAELAHFENCKRIRMTILDHEIKQKSNSFIARHPKFGPPFGAIENWQFKPNCDDWSERSYGPADTVEPKKDCEGIEYVCNAQYMEYIEAIDPKFLAGVDRSIQEQGAKPVILVCFEDDRQNFSIGERLLDRVKTFERGCPIFVWIPRQRELSKLLSDQKVRQETTDSSKASICNLIPFGQCYGSVSYTEVTASWCEWLARYLNLVWLGEDKPGWQPCVAELQAAILADDPVSAMDHLNWQSLEIAAKHVWDKCEEWKRASNRSAAIHSVLKAAVVGERIEGLSNVAGTQEVCLAPTQDQQLRMMEHYRWLSERLLTGWRYDAVNNDDKKTRWQIKSWDGLDNPPQAVIDKARAKGKEVNEKTKDERIVKLLIGLMKSGRLKVKGIGAA